MADTSAPSLLCTASFDDANGGGGACKLEMETGTEPSFSAPAALGSCTEDSEVCARYLFNTRSQEAGETIDEYVAILHTLSSCCNFQHLREGLIRDRVVVGVRSQATRESLLRQSELSLHSALHICRQAEAQTLNRSQDDDGATRPAEPQTLLQVGNSVPKVEDVEQESLADQDTPGEDVYMPHRRSRRKTAGQARTDSATEKLEAGGGQAGGGQAGGAPRRGMRGRGQLPCQDCGRVFLYQNCLLRHQTLHCQKAGAAWHSGQDSLDTGTGQTARRKGKMAAGLRRGRKRCGSRSINLAQSQMSAETGSDRSDGDRGADVHEAGDSVLPEPSADSRCFKRENSESSVSAKVKDSLPQEEGQVKGMTCDLCGKFFVYKRGLLNHRARHLRDRDKFAQGAGLASAWPGENLGSSENGTSPTCRTSAPVDLGASGDASSQESGKLVVDVNADSQEGGGSEAPRAGQAGNAELQGMVTMDTGVPAGDKERSEDRRLRCDLCGKQFGYRRNLLKHRARHLAEGDRFARRAGLAGGRQDVGGEGLAGLEATSCQLCGKTFRKPRYLDRHLLTHVEGRQFACEFCGKTFKTKAVLADHQLCHSGREACTCSYCGRSFLKRAYLKKHERLHTGELPYQCQVCDRRFHLSSGLHFHLLSHSGERKHKCEICGKAFARFTILKKHRIIHSDSRPFACSVCGKGFKSHNELARHELIHKGVKEFICHLCGAGFIRSTHMWQHMRHHHRGEETKWQKRDWHSSRQAAPQGAGLEGDSSWPPDPPPADPLPLPSSPSGTPLAQAAARTAAGVASLSDSSLLSAPQDSLMTSTFSSTQPPVSVTGPLSLLGSTSPASSSLSTSLTASLATSLSTSLTTSLTSSLIASLSTQLTSSVTNSVTASLATSVSSSLCHLHPSLFAGPPSSAVPSLFGTPLSSSFPQPAASSFSGTLGADLENYGSTLPSSLSHPGLPPLPTSSPLLPPAGPASFTPDVPPPRTPLPPPHTPLPPPHTPLPPSHTPLPPSHTPLSVPYAPQPDWQ